MSNVFFIYLCSIFVNIKALPNFSKESVQIVDNVLFGNKVKQRMVSHVYNIDQQKDVVSKSGLKLNEIPFLIK